MNVSLTQVCFTWMCVLGSGDSETIENWMELVQDKNTLLSEESDLMVA